MCLYPQKKKNTSTEAHDQGIFLNYSYLLIPTIHLPVTSSSFSALHCTASPHLFPFYVVVNQTKDDEQPAP